MVTITFYEKDALRDGQSYGNKEDEYNLSIPTWRLAYLSNQ